MSIAVTTPAPPAAAPTQVVDTFKHRATISVLYGRDEFHQRRHRQRVGQGTYQGTPISFNDTSFDNVYGTVGLLKIGFGYRTSPRTEVNLNYVISRAARPRRVQVGTVGTANDPLSAKFDDYKLLGLRRRTAVLFRTRAGNTLLGLHRRHQQVLGHRRRIFVSAHRHNPARCQQLLRFLMGVQHQLQRRPADRSWSDRIHGGSRLSLYGQPCGCPALAEPGLASINSDSKRWSIPVLFGIRVRF